MDMKLCEMGWLGKAGVPKFPYLMPDDQRWSWWNNNRNKVHNKCNVLESLWSHSPTSVHGKIVFHETDLLPFSHSVVSDSLRPRGLQHSRPPCPSLSPGVCSQSHPLSLWCHPTISLSVVPFFSCSQSFPASGSFPVSQLFVSGGQRIGASASASVLPINIQGWFPLGLTGWISLLSKGLSRVFSSTTVQKHQFSGFQPSLWSNSHISTWPLEKPQLWLHGRWLAKWCLCF